ncbi:MAG: 5-(carboxyamino)imidazole ribonucleotide mutase [Thermanaerothrix sp.]|nr:5-(carboxyamino)imidazole ribonucleotide mutase [Thermanaerothrix sp.]
MPDVLIILGSPSDAEHARKCGDALTELGVSFEAAVASAHRTPDRVAHMASRASELGFKVIIAMAGLSAALPGAVAAHTDLPVIGVPLSGGIMGGLDALLSAVQMPPGVPVASVGVDGARNAAILAARIVALSNGEVRDALVAMKADNAKKAVDGTNKLASLGLPVHREDL